jgi:hypothetical protein
LDNPLLKEKIMPCYDSQAAEDNRYNAEMLPKFEAMLCGIVRAFGFDNAVKSINWGEVGITREFFENWWKVHQMRDAQRHLEEASKPKELTREDIIKFAGLSSTEMKTEDLFRQTGRTTRMVKAAVARARQGVPVVIVMKDWTRAEALRKVLDGEPNVGVMGLSLVPNLKWTPLEAIGEYSHHEVFVDHDVVYVSHRKLFELQSMWDPKVDVKGDTMKFVED